MAFGAKTGLDVVNYFGSKSNNPKARFGGKLATYIPQVMQDYRDYKEHEKTSGLERGR
jgi:hypothetical protein